MEIWCFKNGWGRTNPWSTHLNCTGCGRTPWWIRARTTPDGYTHHDVLCEDCMDDAYDEHREEVDDARTEALE